MAVTKKKIRRASDLSLRVNKKKDPSPQWAGHETWNELEFGKHFKNAMDYYRLDVANNDLKDILLKWMLSAGYEHAAIQSIKNTADYKINSTIAGIAGCLLNGMPAQRDDFNGGRNSQQWLEEKVQFLIDSQHTKQASETVKPATTVNVHDRLRDTAINMCSDIEDIYEMFQTNPKLFEKNTVKILNMLRGKTAKAAHARIIREFYRRDIEEIRAAIAGKDEDLKEAYAHRTRPQLKKFLEFLLEVDSACDMLIQEGKVTRRPKVKKIKPVEKIIEKLTYKKVDEPSKLVSINPADIIGATELWVYNVKTRKIGRYIAANVDPKGLDRAGSGLSVKGTTIVGYDETVSIQKTLRKPQEQLAEFKNAGKVALRKYLDSIKAVDIKLNGRINADTILLKASK